MPELPPPAGGLLPLFPPQAAKDSAMTPHRARVKSLFFISFSSCLLLSAWSHFGNVTGNVSNSCIYNSSFRQEMQEESEQFFQIQRIRKNSPRYFVQFTQSYASCTQTYVKIRTSDRYTFFDRQHAPLPLTSRKTHMRPAHRHPPGPPVSCTGPSAPGTS